MSALREFGLLVACMAATAGIVIVLSLLLGIEEEKAGSAAFFASVILGFPVLFFVKWLNQWRKKKPPHG